MNDHYLCKSKIYCWDEIYQFIFGVSPYSYKEKLHAYIVKEMFIENGLKEVWVLKNLFLSFKRIFEGRAKTVKGNPNYQGILSWIIQIFHYYCRKQYKNTPEGFHKKAILKKLVIFKGKHLCRDSFLLKWQAFRPLTVLKRGFNIDIFLWISGNLKEHLFWRTFPNSCFCISGNSVVRTFFILSPPT